MLKQFELTSLRTVAPETEDKFILEKGKQSLVEKVLEKLQFFRNINIDTASLDRLHDNNPFQGNDVTRQLINR